MTTADPHVVPPEDAEAADFVAGDCHPFTDIGNSFRFLELWGDDIMFTKAKGWYVWDGQRWLIDDRNRVYGFAVTTVERMRIGARYLPEGTDEEQERKDRYAKWAHQSGNVARLDAMLKIASAARDVAVTVDELDADGWLFNVGNGTLDLRTGRLEPARRGDRITKLARVDYDPAAPAPTWEAFLRDVQPDPEMRAYLQRLAGYALTASVREQSLEFLHGGGQNGKTTFLNALLHVWGDYGKQSDPNLFVKTQSEQHSTGLADLHGARLVVTAEVDQGKHLAEVLVKQVTGGDKLKARFMRRDNFEFDPTFKVFLAANHKPVISGVDFAIWRRIHLVPFTVRIPDEQKNKDLPDALQLEAAGILAWAVEGCAEWQRRGLDPPAAVLEATRAYRADQDVLKEFLEDRCVVGPDHAVLVVDLYEAYADWSEVQGIKKPWTMKRFSAELDDRGFVSDRVTSGPHRFQRQKRGLRLRLEGEDPGDDNASNTHADKSHQDTEETQNDGFVPDVPGFPVIATRVRARARVRGTTGKPGTPGTSGTKRRIVASVGDLDELLEDLAGLGPGDTVAVDTETTGKPILAGGRCTAIQCAYRDRAWFVPVGCAPGDIPNRDPVEVTVLVDELRDACRRGALLVAHNVGFDAAVLSVYATGGEFLTDDIPIWDTYEVSWLLDENIDHGLKQIAAARWGDESIQSTRTLEAKYGVDHGRWPWDTFTATELFDYAVDDPVHCLRLAAEQAVEVDDPDTPVAEALELRHRFVRVLYRLYRRGVRVDAARVRAGIEAAERRIAELRADPDLQVTVPGRRRGDPPQTRCVNVNSSSELPRLLFDQWGLEPLKKTKSGERDSTSRAVLEKLAYADERVRKVLALRHDLKALSSYYGHLDALRDGDDRIHLQMTTSATTGRLASKGLNILTIPRETTNRELRACFIPAPGRVFYELDLSQAELRVAAGVANDPAMLAALEHGDLYMDMAELCFGERTPTARQRAKPAMLGPPYGLGADRLAEHLVAGTPQPVTAAVRAQAERIKAGYAEKWPRVMRRYRQLAELARQRAADGRVGYIRNPYFPGRYYRFTGETGKSPFYAAFNHLVQGTVLEIMLRVMVDVDAADLPGDLVLQVHDSLLFEAIPGGEADILDFVQRATDRINPFPRIPLRWEPKSWLTEEE